MILFLNPVYGLLLFAGYCDYVLPISLNLMDSQLEVTETGKCIKCMVSPLI